MEHLIAQIRDRARPLTPDPTEVEERKHPLPGIRAVLFDIYGTLLVSASGDIGAARLNAPREAFEEALTESLPIAGDPAAAAGIAEESYFAGIEEVHADRRSAGLAYPEVDIRDVWRRVLAQLQHAGHLSGSHGADSEAAHLVELLALRYELYTNPTWPMPGMVEVLQQLAASVPLGLVSNAQFFTPLLFPAFTGESLEQLGFDPELCMYSYLLGEAKPSPSLFEPVISRLSRNYGIAADEVLYVGNDMLNDIWAAGEAGLKSCLFAGDARSLRLREDHDSLRATSPTCVVTTLSSIPAMLGIGASQ